MSRRARRKARSTPTLGGTPARLALILLGAALGVGAAGGTPPALTVFAASDLTFAFREIIPRFEQTSGARVTLVLGSTGNLARQIESGAPADVLFAADESVVDRLTARGVFVADTRASYAEGRIVLATARRVGLRLMDLRGLLAPQIRHVAIANPLHAPYGRAAEEALRKVGVWEMLKPRLVYGENIRHTLQFVQTGAAEAGIVALSVADVPEIEWTPIDASLHAPLVQAAAVVRGSPRRELGEAFIQFVRGAEGWRIMTRYGFVLPRAR